MGGHNFYSPNHIRRASGGPAECTPLASSQSSRNQHHYLVAAAATAAAEDETSGRIGQKAQVMPLQWPYISSLESLQLSAGQSLSLLDSNKSLDGQQQPHQQRQRQHYLATPNAWRRPLSGAGQCSTFAAADVRRAIRLVTSNSSLSSASSSSFAKPPSTSSSASSAAATYLQLAGDRRRSRKLALVEGRLKGCINERNPKLAAKLSWQPRHLLLAAPAPTDTTTNLKGQPPSKFKSAKQTNECKTVEQQERLASAAAATNTDSLYSTSVDVVAGPSSELINDNLWASKSLDEVSSKHQVKQQQQQPEVHHINPQGEPINSMQSIHSLSMQFDQRQTSIIHQHQQQQQQQQQQQRHLLSQSSSASMGPTSGQLADSQSIRAAQQQQRQLTSSISTNSLMASNKLGRLMGKKASRVKELLLQNLLGRADHRTHDELFEMYEENFFKQQQQAHKIAKEFKNYLNALKCFHEAGKSLNSCIQQATSDYQSARHDLVCENLTQMEQLNEDLLEKLREQVMVNIGQYLTQFAELKDKISKRHRKLIDFDSSRRAFELMLTQIQKKRQQRVVLMNNNGSPQQQQVSGASQSQLARSLKFLTVQQQTVDGQVAPLAPPPPPPSQSISSAGQQVDEMSSDAGQLVDEARLLKLREQFNYCKIMYETINSELHDELPQVYEKKMKSLLRTLQNYFALEAHYHSNAGKLMATASDVIDELPELTAGASLMRRRQAAAAARQAGHFQPNVDDEEDEEEDDEEDHESDDDDDDDDDHSDHHAVQQVLKQVNVNASSSSSDQLYEDAGEVGDGAVVCAKIGGGEGGASSSGVGSSRADSSSSAASSPDLTGSKEAAEESGKAEGPAGAHVEPGPASHEHLLRPGSSSSSADGASSPVDSPAAAAVAVDEAERHNQQAAQEEPTTTTMMVVKDCSELAVEAEVAIEQEDDKKVNIVEAETSGDDDEKKKEVVVVVVAAPVPDDSSKKPTEETTTTDIKVEEPNGGGQSQNGYLYKVKTNYKYLAEDVDELCFEADEVLQVVEFGDSQEPEEGWLMGVREVNGQRGLFPANFTRPI